MLSYQPQGRCTLRCSACSVRLSLSRRLDHLLDVLAALAVGHQHGVGGLDDDHVVDAHARTRRLVACTSVLRLSSKHHVADGGSCRRRPCAATCQTASQAPRSFQPASSGTMRMSNALPGQRSITA